MCVSLTLTLLQLEAAQRGVAVSPGPLTTHHTALHLIQVGSHGTQLQATLITLLLPALLVITVLLVFVILFLPGADVGSNLEVMGISRIFPESNFRENGSNSITGSPAGSNTITASSSHHQQSGLLASSGGGGGIHATAATPTANTHRERPQRGVLEAGINTTPAARPASATPGTREHYGYTSSHYNDY